MQASYNAKPIILYWDNWVHAIHSVQINKLFTYLPIKSHIVRTERINGLT